MPSRKNRRAPNSAAKRRDTAVRPSAVKTIVEGSIQLTIERMYPVSYWSDSVEWLPPRAEIDVRARVSRQAKTTRVQDKELTLALTLTSGPGALYAYFPFNSYLYVDDKLAAIAEFGAEYESQTLAVSIPANERCRLTIVTELSDRRSTAERGGEKRQLALALSEIHGKHTTPRTAYAQPRAVALGDFSQWRTALVPESPEPVFVIGAYRSGTSILTWALGQHPNIWPLEETGWLQVFGVGALAGYQIAGHASRRYFTEYDISAEEYMAYVGSAVDHFLRSASTRYLEKISLQRLSDKMKFGNEEANFQLARSLFGKKRRWVDGAPENAGNIAIIRKMFPLAKFICTVRHPYDVVASMVHMDRTGGKPMSISKAADMWLRMNTWCLQAVRAYGPNVVKVIRHEEVASRPAVVLQDIFDFLDEPRFPKAVSTYQTRINSSSISEAERQEVHSALSASKVGARLLALYEDLASFGAGRDWTADSSARLALEEANNDLISRVLLQFD